MDDHEEFRQAFASNYTDLQLYVLRRAPAADCQGIVSDAFLTAWTKWSSRPKRVEEVRPWLFGITHNTLRNVQRRERQRPDHELHLAPNEVADGTSTLAGQVQVRNALSQLPEADREILRLAAWEQLTTRELAIALDISETAARVRLHRARRRFENLFTKPQALDLSNATTSAKCTYL